MGFSRPSTVRFCGFSLALLLSLGGVSAAAATSSSTITYVAKPFKVFAFAATPTGGFPTPSQCVKRYGLACYTPALIRKAYDVPSSLTGAGETIVIVDAYGSPTIAQDLATFDAAFGLPNPNLHILYPEGQVAFNPNDSTELDWADETSLDVEWAHAIAPAATIDLVVAPSAGGNAINNAIQYAVQNHLGDVLSMSFGAPEAAIAGQGNNLQIQQADAIFQQAVAEGMSLFASAGDAGATNGYATPNANFPASDPNVTAVGGTNLFMSDSGAYRSETTWNDADDCAFGCAYGPFGATGGAPSAVFAAPAYQTGFTTLSARTTADVAYNASVYTAVLVYMSHPGSPAGFYFFGGTSEGAPQWAAIAALADEAAGHDLGLLNPQLYAIAANPKDYAADFHDVTVGDNAFFGPGFPAGTGYDLPTGLGSPDVAHLIQDLAH
jgi:subtilase family serine protease